MNAAPPGARLGLLPSLLRTCVRQAHTGPARRPAPMGYQRPEGHGERIWVFAHRRTEQVIFSFRDRLDGFHDLKQLPFNGKQTKPSKLRKDYWSPMAIIQFPAGMGSVGRSVFQKLRELKHLHEVSWPDEFRYKHESEYTEADKRKIADEKANGRSYRPVRSKADRGNALNAQKKNVIADMAVVLAGKGAGNKVVVTKSADAGKEDGQLVAVTVKWSNDQDMEFAEVWSHNVTHALFEEPAYMSNLVPKQQVAEASQEAKAEA
ncbi:transcriptional regulation of mitochondrial recombination [Hirsutella rhossiliensis]|uniref:Large ribosomal subunit protein mL67 n=1 Tax=Hirsutella rhossiliensis TaxID=111463 RepID=A0A9P8MWV5_9HYPO|nr:transcriptional regulation of mitochondrial recombination [Hirsutella rhossiliensis]KAH0963568.1 transcriptional regulation of mitochondrial recombination [Hirsutella rhossiliensis]